MTSEIKDFPLGIGGFQFSDLYRPLKLKDLHAEFWKYCLQTNPEAVKQFELIGNGTLTTGQEGEILLPISRMLGDFLARLFNVSGQTLKIKNSTLQLHAAFRFKKEFLNTRVFKRFSENPISAEDYKVLDESVKRIVSKYQSPATDAEIVFADPALFLLDAEAKLKKGGLESAEQTKVQDLCSHLLGATLLEKVGVALKQMEDWCVQTYIDHTRRKILVGWISFRRAEKLDYDNLVPVERPETDMPEKIQGPSSHLRFRQGFKLTDARMGQKEYLREIDYCILCHPRQKDSCSHGFKEKTGGYTKNPLGIPLKGCPLDERISEMHTLRKEGELLGSLAVIMLDNPMCPGTGHRICNDCMKGCIYQKQDPVNIPQSETGILTDVLNLPHGFEIYSLLTRFNPLNKARPYALPYNGKNVLVVGLGPAGYTACHYLANEGFGVVGIDGLKLEPIDDTLTGNKKAFPKPILTFNDLKKELDERFLMGFGGVSEYGITVRWDKNFLSVILLSLLRRENVKFYGGVRFGGTLTLEDAWELGFDHVALATGAGRPTIVNMKNNLSRGIRKASDFLMALQLTGAFKKNAMANLQVELPAIVIGGGLTAIDTATELLAYYPIQVEKILERYETLVREMGEENVWKTCDEEEKLTLETFLKHGLAVREERRLAEKEKRNPNFITMCRNWGGVSVAYRKRMQDSPAYRLNHEEIIKALEEGIHFIENVSPVEAIKNRFGAVEALVMKKASGESITLPAKSVCVAAGTNPNTIYEREFPGSFKLDKDKYFFQKYRAEQKDSKWELIEAAPGETGAFFLSHSSQGKFVSFYGDNHPDYNGNVVKAMASAKHGIPHVAKLFEGDILSCQKSPVPADKWNSLVQFLDNNLVPRVHEVNRLTPTIVEIVVKGRYIARKFEPGQFYRLQNYESSAHTIDGTRLITEGMALTGAWVDKEKDLLAMIVLEMGASTRLCSTMKPGDPVVVMGPTGTPSEVEPNETVLLAGGGLGNAVLLSISKAMRAKGCKVIYFAGYKKDTDVFKKKEIEDATDQVVWSVDKGSNAIPTGRPHDLSFVGNIVESMLAYTTKKLQKEPMFDFKKVDRMIIIGSDRMMAAVAAARHAVLKPYLKEDHVAIVSVNSPMQCMMKEVCAQCLQRHVDPKTGKESFVFTCFNQDQVADCVDFKNLNDRLKTNTLSEKLTNRYLDHLLGKAKLDQI